ncbi:MAG: exodeoxyribonuclease VII small subunit [bacterium]|jgi:exodeoxyribonuclease VII small subunit
MITITKARRTKKKISFEEAFTRLEEITSTLEQGNLSLEAAIKIFGEGKELLGYCEELLGEAQEALKIIDLNDSEHAVSGDEEEKE